jgi:uracil-DNA glycosylase
MIKREEVTKEEVLQGISGIWLNILDNPILDRVLNNLNDLYIKKIDFCPPPHQFFEFARLTPFERIRVVIFGQDPYIKKSEAHGLAFSSLALKIPASLKNIFNCLKKLNLIRDSSKGLTANLTNWAKQGVLLLNASLSTRISESLAHQDIWKPYTTYIIEQVIKRLNRPLIFMLWGRFAQGFKTLIKKSYKKSLYEFYTFESAHPSPTAQSRLPAERQFINCTDFVRVNELLESMGEEPINWDPRYDPDLVPPVEEKKDVSSGEESSDEEEEKKEEVKQGRECVCDGAFECSPEKAIVFTDGTAKPNDKSKKTKGGYASVFVECGVFGGTKIYGRLSDKRFTPTNNRGEGYAIMRTLKFLKENTGDWKECKIYTDSEFWKKMIYEYMPAWNDDDFDEHENRDLTKKIWNLWRELIEDTDKSVEIDHVPSHNRKRWKNSKDPLKRLCYKYNDEADKLCERAREEFTAGRYVVREE